MHGHVRTYNASRKTSRGTSRAGAGLIRSPDVRATAPAAAWTSRRSSKVAAESGACASGISHAPGIRNSAPRCVNPRYPGGAGAICGWLGGEAAPGRVPVACSLDSAQSRRSPFVRKILIANRAEIAVRIARACRDAGLGSVAVYAEPDLDSLHVRAADEAYALGGSTAADSYLDIARILKVAAESGADAVHPGYGFLAENAQFAREVSAAGLTWIGPPPEAIEALGDKTAARLIARRVGAPLAPGTEGPVSGPEEVARFAAEHGLPIAIKAAYGGGGRGLKVARTSDEIEPQFESAVREAIAAFGRGECFVERYLDRPRHVETQCLADALGNIVVVSTRDCSLQRRHQKLVEEAPAPFLSAGQEALLRESSKAILREAGYAGAGTCEFLIGQDGTVSFLEVNTRLQVEHPVSEEVSGLDLVREMFRIADGQAVGYGDPDLRGHSIEFRINAEDPGRGFLPAPGTLTAWNLPQGARWPSSRWAACRPCSRSTARCSTIRRSPVRRSPCTRGGSRPSSPGSCLRTPATADTAVMAV